ncbi:MAG: hypothetical protein O7G87_20325 [bacterium]|nr:hypothetical protein [bacterium]
MITKETVAHRLIDYLKGQVELEALVSWAEDVMAEGEIDDRDFDVIREIVARLGLADVAAFGLSWGDAREMLTALGYRPKLEFETL